MKIYLKKIAAGILWILCYFLIYFIGSMFILVISRVVTAASNEVFGSIVIVGLPYFIVWYIICDRRKNNNENRRIFQEQCRSANCHPMKVILPIGNFKMDILACFTLLLPVVVIIGLRIEKSVFALVGGILVLLLYLTIYVLSDLLCWFLVTRDWNKTICGEEKK